MSTEQGPNVGDPDARALIATASAASTALDYLMCSLKDGDPPNVEEIVRFLADGINTMLDRFPIGDTEGKALHVAVRDFLGLDRPDEA